MVERYLWRDEHFDWWSIYIQELEKLLTPEQIDSAIIRANFEYENKQK